MAIQGKRGSKDKIFDIKKLRRLETTDGDYQLLIYICSINAYPKVIQLLYLFQQEQICSSVSLS